VTRYPPRIVVQVPASTSNLGPGFDALGMALQIHSRYEFAPFKGEEAFHIQATGLNAESIPADETNLAYRAFCGLFEHVGEKTPRVAIRITNGIPLERGLGGSGSAILGGLLGANAWLDYPLSNEEILNIAARHDGHADNVAASLLGGLRVACWDGDRVFTLPIQCTDDLQVVLAVPRKRVATQSARTILPEHIPLSDAVFNIGRVALLVAAFASMEYSFLGVGMEDRLHQTYRQALMPEMSEVIAAAKEAGAWGAALSGSGPTIVAYCIGRAEEVGEAMKKTFSRARIDATIHITTIDFRGASTSLLD